MWDDSIPSVDDENDAQLSVEADTADNVSWTDGQRMRLENEFRKAQRNFAYHPAITIRPVRGEPPYEYQVDYRLRTLATNDQGHLQYIDAVSMHIWLPPGFPNQPPVVRPLAAVFHPNIAWEGVYLSRVWQPTDTLVPLIARIGELLVYRNYDPESVVNSVAMEWLSQNSGAVPLDSHADFSAFNGGEPLGRIQRYGSGTLEQIRRALDDMRFALLAEEGAPTADEVKEFARQTRATVSLFLDNDIPENLRQQATAFHDWCRELPDSIPWWEYLRMQRSRASAAQSAAISLKNAAAAFSVALGDLEKLVPQISAIAPASAVKVIPPREKLEPMQLKLPPLARDFEKWNAESRKLSSAMRTSRPEISIALDGALGRRLAAQEETVLDAVAGASRAVQEAIVEVEPIYRRVRPEMQALEQVVGWREYIDMFGKARTLEKQLNDWGSVGVQAYYLDNASESFGPYQFEEPLDLGQTRIVVRCAQRGQIDVYDAIGHDVIGRGTNGSVAIALGQNEGNPGKETRFRLSERCDELVVQIGFIQQQTVDALSRLQRPVEGAKTWCGKISALLADAQQQQNLREAHRKATHRWRAVVTDLSVLSRFKERLATYHLVQRMSEEVPRLQDLIRAAHARHTESTQKISIIMGKSSRDMETDRLIVPPKYAASYVDELRARDQAKHEVARVQAILKVIARDLTARLSAARLCGRSEIPGFQALPPLPDTMANLADAMRDEALQKMITTLGERLGAPLPFNPPPASTVTKINRPAQPAGAGLRVPHPGPAQVPELDVIPTKAPATSVVEHVAKIKSAPEESTSSADPAGLYAEPVEHAVPDAEHSFDFAEESEKTPADDEMIEGF